MGDGIVGRFIKHVCRSTRIDKYKDGLATNVNDARWRGAEGRTRWRGGVEDCLLGVDNKSIGRVLLRIISYLLDKTRALVGSGAPNFGKKSIFATRTTRFPVGRAGNSMRKRFTAISTERMRACSLIIGSVGRSMLIRVDRIWFAT